VGRNPEQADVLFALEQLRRAGHHVRIVFLDCSTPELVRRYDSTRRRHPLDPEGETGLEAAIEAERRLLEPLKGEADLVIDTTALNVHQLKARILDAFIGEGPDRGMQTTIMSFGFKHGLPLDVDVVLDCRFLPNPYWIDRLRDQNGLDPEVREYVLGQPTTDAFLDHLDSLFDLLMPAFTAEGKSYLTVAFGCTGGRHRSVTLAEELALRLRAKGHYPRVKHRDVKR
jgi:RNase adapter protein RapZ